MQVWLDGTLVADTTRARRVLETSHPPTFYLPMEDIYEHGLTVVDGSSFCEWKGAATYFDVATTNVHVSRAAWTYLEPSDPFRDLRGHVAFYPAFVDCTVGGETVLPQPGAFYGGWVTPDVVGPFKGEPGTEYW
ncbi:MAG: DUF427 domain-containing protein [Actinomycetota bacterium]